MLQYNYTFSLLGSSGKARLIRRNSQGTAANTNQKTARNAQQTPAGQNGGEVGDPFPQKNTMSFIPVNVIKNICYRIQFVCSLCKFRTFYSEEMTSHVQSEFHKEHFRYVGGKLPKQSADFLQEYVIHKTKKTEERRNVIEDLSSTIHQIYRDQDLTQDLGMEHFVKKVEAAHCAACDIFIPMNFSALQRHIRTPIHNQNRRNMMENSKKTALAVARSILNNKLISQKLERYIKGQNPFTEEQDEASGSSNTGLEVSEEQGTVAAVESSCESQDLPACSASTSSVSVLETLSSEDASETVTGADYEMCHPGDQEEFTDTGIIVHSPLEHERSEDL
uniref:C2H2 AKAP95-type domain-containing protein n=1 Tax=Pyxicephalus adspersus TaxID=30357 RepID=A0AAV3B539_PYXAD|nr:TPA: hypothetical protein GDO54_006135 [Pyxicephalus adspersus]